MLQRVGAHGALAWGLTSSSAECLYKLLHRTMGSRGLVDWYVVSSWAISLICTIYLPVIITFSYIPCECSGSLGRYYDGSGMSVGLQIALLLHLGHSPVGVFHCGMSRLLLAILVYFVPCPGLVVVGF